MLDIFPDEQYLPRTHCDAKALSLHSHLLLPN